MICEHKPSIKKVSYQHLLTDCFIGCLTAIYDIKQLGKIYMPNMQKRQDFMLWLKILSKIDFAYLYPEVTAIYTVRKNSVSSSKFKLGSVPIKLLYI